MFEVQGTQITMSIGDTGAIKFTASVTRRDTGAAYTFGERDRALFSIKRSGAQIVKQKSYQMTDNEFKVIFFNSDTDALASGGYNWDVRYVINPYYDDIAPGGPWPKYSELEFPIAAGQRCDYGNIPYIANQAISAAEAWDEDHWDAAWPDYSDLTFPVAKGDQCMHGGTYYMAGQAINSSEDWTAEHWICADNRVPVDGDQVITPNQPMSMQLLTIVGDI